MTCYKCNHCGGNLPKRMDQRRLLHRQSWRSATRDSVSVSLISKQKQVKQQARDSQIQNLDCPSGVMRGVPSTMLGG